MIVCVCRRVSDREIARHARAGLSFDEIQFELGVATQCGRCESCARDVVEMMLAGATAVQIGAANLVDPYICRDIIEDLPAVMAQLGIHNLNDIIGGAHS